MKIHHLRWAALILLLIKLGVICYEFLHVYYGEIPDFLVDKNLTVSKSLHLAKVKKFLYFFVFEFLTAILIFEFSIKNFIIRISRLNANSNKTFCQFFNETKDKLKMFMPGFLLVVSFFITNFQVSPFRESVNYSLLYSAAIYIIFKFSYYWISFIILGWMIIRPIIFGKSSRPDEFIVSNNILPKIVRKWFTERNLILRTYNILETDKINMGVYQESNQVDIIIFGDWRALGFQNEFESCLFHELGHINYQTKFFCHLLIYIIVLMLVLVYYYVFNKFIKSKKNYVTKDMVYLFLYLQIITNPIILVSINGFRQYHEYLSDSYAVDNGFKEGIKSYFKKRLLENYYQKNYSVLYGLYNFHHPPMKKRLDCL